MALVLVAQQQRLSTEANVLSQSMSILPWNNRNSSGCWTPKAIYREVGLLVRILIDMLPIIFQTILGEREDTLG